MQFAASPLGVAAINQAGTASFTWAVSPSISQGKLPLKGQEHVTFCLQFGNITGLTATVAVTIDGVAGNPPMVTSTGVVVAAGGTITASDGMQVFGTMPIGVTSIAITATAGSGNVELILLTDATCMIAAQQRAISAAGSGIPVGATPFAVDHQPAENTVATIAQAAPGAGYRLVIKNISVSITNDNAAPTAGSRAVTMTEETTGVRWGHTIGIPAVAGAMSGIVQAVHIVCAANKSATLAFASAGGTDTIQSVYMDGYIEAV